MSEEKRENPSLSGHLKCRATSVDIEIDFPSTLLSAIPDSYQFIPFKELAPYDNYENKCILGRIESACPIHIRAKSGCLRKILLVDAYERNGVQPIEAKLTVYLFGAFAEASTNFSEGSLMAITNFHTEHLIPKPGDKPIDKSKFLPIQVLVMVSPSGDEGPNVWLAHKKLLPNGHGISDDKLEESAPEKVINEEMEVEEEDSEYEDENDENCNGVPIAETSRRSYQYTKLKHIADSNSKALYNVYGIVEYSKMHLNQARKSYNLHLRISDETLSDFPCTVMGGKTGTHVDANVGDVIRIHRMVVETVRDKLKGKCLSPKFVVVFDKNKEEKEPRSIAKTFVYTNEDRTEVKKLFDWVKRMKRKLICEIKRDEFADFFCQVIGVYIAKRTNAVVLTVWDGTKTTEFESEHRGYSDEKIDHNLFDIARYHFVTLFVYGNYGLVAGDLQPGAYIEVKDAQLQCPKSNPDNPLLVIHPQQKDRRGVFVLDPNDEKLAVLKRRLAKIAEDVNQNPNRRSPDKDNFFLNCRLTGISSPKKNENLMSGPSTSSGGYQESDAHMVDTSENVHMKPSAASAPDRSSLQEPPEQRETSGSRDSEDSDRTLSLSLISSSTSLPSNVLVSAAENNQMPETEGIGISSHVSEGRTSPPNNSSLVPQDSTNDGKTVQKGQHSSATLAKDQNQPNAIVNAPRSVTSPATSKPHMVTSEELPSGQTGLDNSGKIISVVKAGVEPGQSTQEFGGVYKEMNKQLLSTTTNVPTASEISATNGPMPHPIANLNQDNQLVRPTQFSRIGPAPKYNMFGQQQQQRQPETENLEPLDEWWKNAQTVTVTLGHSNVKPSRLVEVAAHSVPYKFRVLAAALKMKPDTTSIRKLIRLYCPRCHLLTEDADPVLVGAEEVNGLSFYLCPQCSTSSGSSSGQSNATLLMYTYLVTFSLHDGSDGNIDAFLWKDNAVKFFCGITPEEALRDSAVADSVFSMLWKVCPNARPAGSIGSSSESGKFSFYPALDCCLMSYTAGGMTRYQIFDTGVKE